MRACPTPSAFDIVCVCDWCYCAGTTAPDLATTPSATTIPTTTTAATKATVPSTATVVTKATIPATTAAVPAETPPATVIITSAKNAAITAHQPTIDILGTAATAPDQSAKGTEPATSSFASADASWQDAAAIATASSGKESPGSGSPQRAGHGTTLVTDTLRPGATGSSATTTRPIDVDATGSDDDEDRGSMVGVIVSLVVLAVCGLVAGVALVWRHHWRKSKDALIRRHTLNRLQRQQHAAAHVDNHGFQPDKALPATPGYVEDSSIQVNQGSMDYAIPLDTDPTYAASVDDTGYGAPLTTATADPTYSQPLEREPGGAHYAATPLTTAYNAAGGVHYAATPLTTADEETNGARYGASLTTAGSIYSVPLDAHSANDSQT